jgi:glyoxylate reductase
VNAAERPRIAVTGRLPELALDLLRAAGEVVVADTAAPLPRAELLAHVAGAAAVVCFLYDRADAELLDAAGPGLRVLANLAVGFDNVDLAAAAARAVAVANTPGVLDDATADLTMALLLAAARRLGEGERWVRSGRPWAWSFEMLRGRDLRDKRLGLVGMGAIGGRVARRASAFGVEIAYANRSPADPELVAAVGARRLDLDELLRTSDFVSLHCPLTAETRGLISAERLALMKPEAILVNTARGPVVDEAALVAALREGRLAAAALDVYEHEPEIHPELLALENATLLPHLGSATVETREEMAGLAARNVVTGLRGGPLLTPVPH